LSRLTHLPITLADVLTVALMLQCCVRLSVVCNVSIVGKQVFLTEKLSEEANKK